MSYAKVLLINKLEDFARNHRFETKAGLVLMSFLNGDCEHESNPCELCGYDEDDEDFDESEEP
jgi:hypothetical protein